MSTLKLLFTDRRTLIGTIITALVVLLAVFGPWLAPYGEYEIVGKPFTLEGSFLGTDYLGQDVLSRVLYGGQSILITAILATVVGLLLGVLIGVTASYVGGWLDEILMRLNDVLLAFPQILVALLVLSAVEQPRWWMLVLIVGISHAPRIARVARGVALTFVQRDFITAADAIGEKRWRIIFSELGPNLAVPLLAEAGLRLTYSIGMIAGIGFLGFATDPGAADWGQMTNENRLALLVQPWGVLAPVLIIGLFTVGTNLIADGIGQRASRGELMVNDVNPTPDKEDLMTSDTNPVAVCTVENMGVNITGTDVEIVDGVSMELFPGEILSLVGESGSGKTTSGTALLGYARTGATISAGSIMVAGRDIRSLSPTEVRKIRGLEIGYVPQDPSSALNPAIRIGKQLRELLDMHQMGTPEERDTWIRDILPEVGLPNDDEFLRRFPHQLSGGQVQRVAIAMMFLPRPKVLVLDEPTTGLDVTTQAMVLRTLDELCERFQVAALYVTHDLAVVATISDRVAVMYAGQIVELGPTRALFNNPGHPYTQALLNAIPHLHESFALTGIPGRTPAPGNRPDGCRFHDRCKYAVPACAETEPVMAQAGPRHEVRCIRLGELPEWDPKARVVADTDPNRDRDVILSVMDLNVFYGQSHVVHDVSFDVARREVVALVGESGSGKTTISRSVGGIHDQWEGSIELQGRPAAQGSRKRTAEQRQRVQYIFQNPYLSLNPRRTVEQILVRPLEVFGLASGRKARERAAELLESVQLGESALSLRTNRLSGGERQRVAIARALAAEPEVLVCDEITSALDVSIQGSIVELLEQIKQERQVAMLFVTHDLALVRTIADRILVLNKGRLVESGLTAQVLDHPTQEYTQQLVANTPTFAEMARY